MTRAELLELLKKARKQLKKYHVPKDEQTVRLSIDTLETALSEQPTIVKCKDCKHWWYGNYCDKHGKGQENADWFCADGEQIRVEDLLK